MDTPGTAAEPPRDTAPVISAAPQHPVTPAAASVPAAAQPFGSNLFTGSAPAQIMGGASPNYKLTVGDRVMISIYGAVQQDITQTIDPQGNIFLPQFGPVHVEGIAAGDLSDALRAQMHDAFDAASVKVYATIMDARPIGVFVTGYVARPGRIAGQSSDSVLDYLVRAGGIVNNSGSYRDVQVKRGGKTISRVDLYDFLTSGKLNAGPPEDGDTIVVGAQHGVVSVAGSVRNSAIFEFSGRRMTGRELTALAYPLPGVSHVLIQGTRNRAPISLYLPLGPEFDQFELADQDKLTFDQDVTARTITVSLQGSYEGPSTYVVPEGTSLVQVLNQVSVDPSITNTQAVHLRRVSLAQQQAQSLTGALDRLQRSVLTAMVQTSGEAGLRQAEAQMVTNFIDRARQARPDGTLVVADAKGQINDLQLEDHDTIIIPRRSNTVLLSGEVLVPQTVVWVRGETAKDYVKLAGGYTDRADTGRLLVQKPNGAIIIESDPEIGPGDELVALPAVEFKTFQFVQDLATTLFRIAGVYRVFELM